MELEPNRCTSSSATKVEKFQCVFVTVHKDRKQFVIVHRTNCTMIATQAINPYPMDKKSDLYKMSHEPAITQLGMQQNNKLPQNASSKFCHLFWNEQNLFIQHLLRSRKLSYRVNWQVFYRLTFICLILWSWKFWTGVYIRAYPN